MQCGFALSKLWSRRVYKKNPKYFELKLTPSANELSKSSNVEKFQIGHHDLLNAWHLISTVILVCEPNVVQLSGTAISKYQNVNESLNSKFDLANYVIYCLKHVFSKMDTTPS